MLGLTGIEAPRNSLDIVSVGSGNSDIPKISLASKVDIPYGFKTPKSTTSEDYSSDNEKKRRSPNVVARLMGLDALPNAESATISDKQQSQNLKHQKDVVFLGQSFVKDADAIHINDYPRSAQLNTGKQIHAPSKHKQHDEAEEAYERGHLAFDSVATREEHPQEKQLQEFKKQFASKFSVQNRDELEIPNREVDVKRVMVLEKMDEKKVVPAPTVESDPKNDPRRLAVALEKLNKSKEFQDVLEVLQSNKEFFLKFLQDPNALLLDKTIGIPVAEENTQRPPPAVEVKAKEQGTEAKPEKKRGGMSPTAFARRFMEFRREGKKSKAKPKSHEESSKSRREREESTTRPSSAIMTKFRGRSKSTSPEMDADLPVCTSEEHKPMTCSTNNCNMTEPHSPGNIVVLMPGSADSTVSNTASNARISKAGRESFAKSDNAREDTRAYPHQVEATNPSFGNSNNDWDDAPTSDDVSKLIKERIWLRLRDIKDKNEKERSKESRDIARDIIREARASVRAAEIVEPPPSVGEFTCYGSGSEGKRNSMRMSPDAGEREVTAHSPVTISKPTLSSRDDLYRAPSGLSNLSNSFTRKLNPWAAPGILNSKIDQRHRRTGHNPSPLQLEQQKLPRDLRSAGLDTADSRPGLPRLRSVPSSSRVLRKAIAGSVLENRVLASESCYPPPYDNIQLPQLNVKGGLGMTSTSQSDEDSLTSSPTLSASSSLQRCRSVPNAALGREGRFRAEQLQNISSQFGRMDANISSNHSQETSGLISPHSNLSGDESGDSYRRGVEAVGSLFARAKSKERNKVFVRSRRKPPTPVEEFRVPLSSITSQDPPPSERFQESKRVSRSLNFSHRSDTSSDDSLCDANLAGKSSLIASHHLEAQPDEISGVKRPSFSNDTALRSEQNQARIQMGVSNVGQSRNETLSILLTPQGRQVRVNADLATDNSSRCGDATTDVLEVPAGDELARYSELGPIAPKPPKTEDVDAEETGVYKRGQPSPVSVFDPPFDEDSPRPLEFSTIPHKLQEFRLRLRKLDKRAHKADARDIETRIGCPQSLESDKAIKEATFIDSVCNGTRTVASTPEAVVPVPLAQGACNDEREWLESIDVEDLPCPHGNRQDLLYVRNLLVVSEFVESASKVFMRWYSIHQPLHPILFENLEEYYNQHIYEPQFRIKDGHIESTGVTDAKPVHIMLFDAVNEVLLKKLSPYLAIWPWVHPGTRSRRLFPLGKSLVWETWIELCSYFPSSNEDDSTIFLLDRDLGRRHEWTGENVEELGLELENAIFDSLIDDTVCSLTRTSTGSTG